MATSAPQPAAPPQKSPRNRKSTVVAILAAGAVATLLVVAGLSWLDRTVDNIAAHMSPKSVSSEKVLADYLTVDVGKYTVTNPDDGSGYLPVTVHNKHRDDWGFEVSVTASYGGSHDFDDQEVALKCGETKRIRFFDSTQHARDQVQVPTDKLRDADFSVLKALLAGV